MLVSYVVYRYARMILIGPRRICTCRSTFPGWILDDEIAFPVRFLLLFFLYLRLFSFLGGVAAKAGAR